MRKKSCYARRNFSLTCYYNHWKLQWCQRSQKRVFRLFGIDWISLTFFRIGTQIIFFSVERKMSFVSPYIIVFNFYLIMRPSYGGWMHCPMVKTVFSWEGPKTKWSPTAAATIFDAGLDGVSSSYTDGQAEKRSSESPLCVKPSALLLNVPH